MLPRESITTRAEGWAGTAAAYGASTAASSNRLMWMYFAPRRRRFHLADQQYDVVVIGSGPGGYVAGIRAGQLGMKVAVIEKDPFLGGTCLHRGCIPTKSLLENADIWTKIQKSKEFGITVGDVTLDWNVVQTRKQGVVDANAKGIEFLFKKN